MRAKRLAKTGCVLAAGAAFGVAAGAAIGHAQGFRKTFTSQSGFASTALANATGRQPLVLVQNFNSSSPFTLQQQSEPTVSPINPGTLPGTTAAIGGSATGTNPVTGLPCNGAGSLAISGAGGLPGAATPPPQDSTETLDQIPVGTPPTTSVFGSQNNLGSC